MLTLLMALTAAMPQAQDFSWSGEIRADQRVAVRNIVGEVRVERASGRQVEVVATKRSGRYGDPRDVVVTAEESARGVTICVRYPGMRQSRSRNDGDGCHFEGGNDSGNQNRNDTEVNFVVRLPAGVRIDAATVSGNVIADGMSGEAEVTSVSGDVTVTGFTGASLEATTVSGDVTLRGIRGRRVEAETVSGNVAFEGALNAAGRYDFTTLSGRVLVDLPAGSGAEIEASTFSGRVRMPAGIATESNRRRNRMSGTLGSGGAALNLESFSGSVEVRVGAR